MVLKIYKLKLSFLQFLLLAKTVTYAIPVDQDSSEFNPTVPTIDQRNSLDNSSDPRSNEDEIAAGKTDNDETFDIMNVFKDIDLNIYKEVHEDGHFKTLCWAELLILKEDNKNNNMTLSREFSIILESPGDIPKENILDEEIVSYELVEGNTKKSKIMNFTTVSRTEEFTIREHKTLFCGSGPILTKEYSEWPKLNKRKIEIRLTPTTPTVWRICRKNVLVEGVNENKPTTPSCNTFDTTETSDYTLTATEKPRKNSHKPRVSEKEKNKRNKIKIKSTKSITFLSDSNEKSNLLNKFAGIPHDLEYTPSENDNLGSYPDHSDSESIEEVLQQPEVESDVELLRRNMYFKKYDGTEENFTDSITAENTFRPLDKTSFLLDLIFPNKSVLDSLYDTEVRHKFLIKIKIEIEHRTLNVHGQERTDSVIGLEEDSVYHTVPNARL